MTDGRNADKDTVDPTEPRLVGVTISDNVTGMYAVNGIVSALYERDRTQVGRRVEVSMLECWIGFTPDAFAHPSQGLADPGVDGGDRAPLLFGNLLIGSLVLEVPL